MAFPTELLGSSEPEIAIDIRIMNHDNTDANGWGYRSGGGHIIGESMPGTIGNAERVLHDQDGQTPTVDPSIEIPAEETEECIETVEDDGISVDELVNRF